MNAFEPTPLERFLLAFWALYAVLFKADVAVAVARIKDARAEGGPPAAGHEPTWASRETPPPPPAAATLVAPPTPLPPTATPEPRAHPAPAPAHVPAPAPAPAKAAPSVPAVPPRPAPDLAAGAAAVDLLALLQREGRLLDFVEEELSGATDRAIGAAAREVHAGCKRALGALFALEPVVRGAEGEVVTLEPGWDPVAVRFASPPPKGAPARARVRHHGWRVKEVRPPATRAAGDVLQPAEVEPAA